MLNISCNQDGPCEDPYKWKLESNSAPGNISVKIKKNKVDINVLGEGEITLLVKNHKSILGMSYVSGDYQFTNKDNDFNYEERTCEILVNNDVIGSIEIIENRAHLKFYKAFDSSSSVKLYLSGLESGGTLTITSNK